MTLFLVGVAFILVRIIQVVMIKNFFFPLLLIAKIWPFLSVLNLALTLFPLINCICLFLISIRWMVIIL